MLADRLGDGAGRQFPAAQTGDVDGGAGGRTDCGGALIPSSGADAMPVVDRDSTYVLTEDVDSVLGEPDFGGDPRFRPLPLRDGPAPARIDAPRGVFYAFPLGEDEVLALAVAAGVEALPRSVFFRRIGDILAGERAEE